MGGQVDDGNTVLAAKSICRLDSVERPPELDVHQHEIGHAGLGGAQGVGMATTNAVVSASILILTFNYFITEAFFAL